MRFALTQAPYAAKIIQDAIARRRDVPPPFDNPPMFDVGERVFLKCFQELSDERPVGQDIHPIKRGQVVEWCLFYGWRDLEFIEECVAHMRAMDAVWIEHEIKRRKEQAAKDKRKAADARSPKLRQKA